MEVPGGEEEGEEVGDAGAFEANAGVFPMAVEFFDVDIFVGEVETAGIADFAVDDDDFAVVAVIMETIETGIELVARGTMDADGFEVAIVAGGESEDAADVVIHNVGFDAFVDFFLEDSEDLVPHTAGADDEEFEEDEAFGGLEVDEKLFEVVFADGKISGFGVFGEGDVVGFANVTGLEGDGGIFLF